MPEIRTETEIDAPPAAVWGVLADVDAYPAWNPLVVSVTGELQRGAIVRIRVKTPGRPPVPMLARVSAVEPPRRLQWVGGLPGLFAGRHTFELYPVGGGTRFVHRERFAGLLAPRVVDEDLERAYRDLNRSLAARVREHRDGHGATGG